MEGVTQILLALGVPVAMLFISRQLMHYFQLESYQFQGYFRTLWRQKKKVIWPLVLLAAASLVVIFGGALVNEMLKPNTQNVVKYFKLMKLDMTKSRVKFVIKNL